MLRYIKRLEGRDLSLTSAMIPLGSCTMKLNATTEMVPLSWREFNRLHPFAPREQATGYRTLFRQLEDMLAEITRSEEHTSELQSRLHLVCRLLLEKKKKKKKTNTKRRKVRQSR